MLQSLPSHLVRRCYSLTDLLGYGALLWLFFHIVVIAYEEPTLRQDFGAEYETYCANVPRWLPRITPRAV